MIGSLVSVPWSLQATRNKIIETKVIERNIVILLRIIFFGRRACAMRRFAPQQTRPCLRPCRSISTKSMGNFIKKALFPSDWRAYLWIKRSWREQ